ncbi:hypothetical protein PO909_017898 [Leuciscus waleckii]
MWCYGQGTCGSSLRKPVGLQPLLALTQPLERSSQHQTPSARAMDKKDKVMDRTLTLALRAVTSLNTVNRAKVAVTTKECMVRVSPPPFPMRCEPGSAG